ncbi:MAG: type II toxin-antitoxin system VapC family toxin [Xenococcus sp. (in: cyanobacteria)]
MNIVADTNIFLAIALNEPEKEHIIELTLETRAIAPEILPYEIGNALSAMNKRKRISYEEALSAFEITNLIPVRLVSIDIQKALKLAFEFNIYAYDAYFLQCAKSFACPLITLDKRMKQVAIDINIDLL